MAANPVKPAHPFDDLLRAYAHTTAKVVKTVAASNHQRSSVHEFISWGTVSLVNGGKERFELRYSIDWESGNKP